MVQILTSFIVSFNCSYNLIYYLFQLSLNLILFQKFPYLFIFDLLTIKSTFSKFTRFKGGIHMTKDLYQKGIDKIQELTQGTAEDPTSFMDIGESFEDIAPDLSRYVVEFAFGNIYSRPGLSNKQKVLTTI